MNKSITILFMNNSHSTSPSFLQRIWNQPGQYLQRQKKSLTRKRSSLWSCQKCIEMAIILKFHHKKRVVLKSVLRWTTGWKNGNILFMNASPWVNKPAMGGNYSVIFQGAQVPWPTGQMSLVLKWLDGKLQKRKNNCLIKIRSSARVEYPHFNLTLKTLLASKIDHLYPKSRLNTLIHMHLCSYFKQYGQGLLLYMYSY